VKKRLSEARKQAKRRPAAMMVDAGGTKAKQKQPVWLLVATP
jgi:hypothetical protein